MKKFLILYIICSCSLPIHSPNEETTELISSGSSLNDVTPTTVENIATIFENSDFGAENAKTFLIFVTEEQFTPKIPEKFDEICNDLANKAGIHGNFISWISSSNRNLKNLIPENDYQYKNILGQVVAESWYDLMNGNVILPIRYNQLEIEVFSYVWTGTLQDASNSGYNCEDWTTLEEWKYGTIGFSYLEGKDWTNMEFPRANPMVCYAHNSIYCVQTSKI